MFGLNPGRLNWSDVMGLSLSVTLIGISAFLLGAVLEAWSGILAWLGSRYASPEEQEWAEHARRNKGQTLDRDELDLI